MRFPVLTIQRPAPATVRVSAADVQAVAESIPDDLPRKLVDHPDTDGALRAAILDGDDELFMIRSVAEALRQQRESGDESVPVWLEDQCRAVTNDDGSITFTRS